MASLILGLSVLLLLGRDSGPLSLSAALPRWVRTKEGPGLVEQLWCLRQGIGPPRQTMAEPSQDIQIVDCAERTSSLT